MKIVQIPNGQFAENCYLVIDEAGGVCAVIDPGEEADLILRAIAEAGVRPAAIWLTHAHLDHVMGVPRLRRERDVPIYLHPADREFVPGERVEVGALGFTVRHAPGHSPGSVCLVGDGGGVVFTGDVLFAGSIGRTDLPGADFGTLMRSIERELLVLPDSTIVYSGHGPETTVGRERGTNPFLTGVHRVA